VTRAQLEDLVARFLDRTLTHAEWTHAAHLAVGAWHVHHLGAEDALATLRTRIRALNARQGTLDTTTTGYHETVTAAYVWLLADALAAAGAGASLEARVTSILAGPLADKALLLRFWSREALMSPAARAAWMPPDLSPLTLPTS
jgi:hypothetical protein